MRVILFSLCLITALFICQETAAATQQSICERYAESDEKGTLDYAFTASKESGITDKESIPPAIAEVTTVVASSIDSELECWIIDVTVSCGGTYETQYCDEGLRGISSSPISFLRQLRI